uniref:Uncharacterized protein n=1 Tax=Arundo donax TaxID=35708 RepID=A0A0A9G2X1_ARUDO
MAVGGIMLIHDQLRFITYDPQLLQRCDTLYSLQTTMKHNHTKPNIVFMLMH